MNHTNVTTQRIYCGITFAKSNPYIENQILSKMILENLFGR